MLRTIGLGVAAALLAPLPQPVHAQGRGQAVSQPAALQREIGARAGRDLQAFYAARGNQPLWLNEFGRPSGAASMLVSHLRTAQFDGVDPKKLKVGKLAKALDKARRGNAKDAAKAEIALSTAFAAYVRAMRGAGREQMIYESQALAPVVPTVGAALSTAAASAEGLEDYVAEMRWMHPLYAPLRNAMEDPRFSESQRRQMWTNLARVRAIPAMPMGRHILVDAASATLWMYEDGKVVDSMKVV
ncbi:MAG TPA: hypothetical protein VFS49_11565, partial [Croceibacterium sp.]|nr:hypothetical protein [Croceibacterium sp.]